MLFHLNLLHLVLLLGAIVSVSLALREIRGRTMRRARLYLLPMVATLIASVLTLFALAAKQPPWALAATFMFGVVAGAVRGATMKVEVDQNWHLLRPASRRALFWVAMAIPVAVGLEIGGAIAGPPAALVRLAGAGIGLLCAGLLVGRAAVFAIRLARAPHVDLRRR